MNHLQEYCSSGCESGWTLYLDHHSSISPHVSCNQEHDFHDQTRNRSFNTKRLKREEETEETEDEEDSSMLSDASSGPPHFNEEEEEEEEEEESYDVNDTNNGCFHHYRIDTSLSKNSLYRQKTKRKRSQKAKDQSTLLDDTASSSLSDYSNKSFTLKRSQSQSSMVEEYSQGYSTTRFDVSFPYQEHYVIFQSSMPENLLQQNQLSSSHVLGS
ncbi:hypothetical protein ACJIZ3_015592 [Penstemon smallii]|uniref:Uncharacterized protein n=1 Tax=Penstemon smallii TaxID=265156 RepID=A0ABD3RMY1_9LAMI